MESRKDRESISKLDNILSELSNKKIVSQQKLSMFYGYLETMYDEGLQKVEDVILKELSNKNKQKEIIKLLNVMPKE